MRLQLHFVYNYISFTITFSLQLHFVNNYISFTITFRLQLHFVYNYISFAGEFALPLQITEFAPNRRVVMESDSLLKPRFVFSVEDGGQSYTKVSLK